MKVHGQIFVVSIMSKMSAERLRQATAFKIILSHGQNN